MTRTTGRRLIAAVVLAVVLAFVALLVPGRPRDPPAFWWCEATSSACVEPAGASLTQSEVSWLELPASGGGAPCRALIAETPSWIDRLRRFLGLRGAVRAAYCCITDVRVGSDGRRWERWAPGRSGWPWVFRHPDDEVLLVGDLDGRRVELAPR